MLKRREPLFSGWSLTDFLGAGVSGCVFKMEREDLGQKFLAALKVIPLTRKLDREIRSMDSLQESIGQDAREIIHLYSLGNHQNLVGWYNHEIIYEIEKDTATALVAVMMEYLPRTLSELIKDGPLPWEQAVQLTIDCLKGMEHVHAANIIHRDIKPGNIFVTNEGRAKLGDFGVARKLAEREQAETRVGTPLYIAPEVVKDPLGQGYAYPADVYSLGLVLYELLTGKLPFETVCQGNKNCMVAKRLAGEPFTLERQFSPGLTIATLGSLAYSPALRYATAAEFRIALEKVLETQGRETNKPKAVEQLAAQAQAQAKEAPRLDKPKNIRAPIPANRSGSHAIQSDDDDFPSFGGQKSSTEKQHYYGGEFKPSEGFKPEYDAFMASGLQRFMQQPQVILLLAAAGCGLTYYLRNSDLLYILVLAFFYLALPVYYLIVNTALATLIIGAFFGSLCVYNYLYYGRIEGIFDSVAMTFLGIYIAFFAGAYWLRHK